MHVNKASSRVNMAAVLLMVGTMWWAVSSTAAQTSSAAVAQPTAPNPAAPNPAVPTESAGAWLAAQASDGVLTNNGEPDAGLMADAAIAAAAIGDPGGARIVERLAALTPTYVAPAEGVRLAGSLAKLLLVADIWGLDPSDFGDVDLRTELLARLRPTGDPEQGRFSNLGVTDSTNLFSQSLAVIALARTGGVPQSAVDYLVAQQCPGGGFRLFLSGTVPCTNDANVDPDATALGLQALLAAGRAAPADRATSALVALQQADGSFRLAPPSNVTNSNTTGLAAQALRAAGATETADSAASWIVGLQLGCNDGAAAADAGAVAYDTAALTAARTAGITSVTRDQFRRATAQAVLAFGARGLGELRFDDELDVDDAQQGEGDGEDEDGAAEGQMTPPTRVVCASAPTTTTSTTPTTSSTSTPSTTSTSTTRTSTTTVAVAISSVMMTIPPAAVQGTAVVRSSTGTALAATGAASSTIAGWAIIALLAGSALVLWSRRRA